MKNSRGVLILPVAILVLFCFVIPVNAATYNEPGKYIEGINVSVNTTNAFNRSYSVTSIPLWFQINNSLNTSATSFNIANQTGLIKSVASVNAGDWFWVNASSPGTYWVNVSNAQNASEYVNFTVVYYDKGAWIDENGNGVHDANESFWGNIQGAVNGAVAGNIIIVHSGTYNENVVVNVNHLTVKSESGSANCIVSALTNTNHVFNVTADYVNITGFTIKDATGSGAAGIYLSSADYCNISDNTVTNNGYGIYLSSSNNNTLTSNTANSNIVGISLNQSSNNTLTNNTAYNSTFSGISLRLSNSNTLTSNNASNNDYGVYLDSSSNNTLTNNTANSNNWHGIWLYQSNNNTLTNNTANSNSRYGIYLSSSNNNTLTSNIANSNNNYDGIHLESSDNNTITNNTANSNNRYGIHLQSSSNNLIYNNYFNNTNNAYDNGNNIWNTTKTSGTNIVGGPYLGGNYWSDYTGIDTDHDGLGDTNYTIAGGSNSDEHPLVISPAVVSTSPSNGATGVLISTNIVITFNKSMNQSAVENNLAISPSIGYSCSWSNSNTTLTIDPSSSLSYSTTYTVKVGWDAADEQGNVMLDNYTFSFTTRSKPYSPPGGGAGGGGYVIYLTPTPSPTPQQPPVAVISAPDSALVEQTIHLDASSSYDPDGSIVSYTWDFGDGNMGHGITATHSYPTPGRYTITLTVVDNDGLSNSTSKQIEVQPTPTMTVTPTATPTATPTLTPTVKQKSRQLIPGFEVVYAIAGLMAVAYLLKRKRA